MMMKIALLLTLSYGAFAIDCRPGMKAVTTAGTTCTKSLTADPGITGEEEPDSAEYEKRVACGACCEMDNTVCAGSTSVACNDGFYWPTDRKTLAWAQTKTTNAKKNSDCCLVKPKCAEVTCDAQRGLVMKASVADTQCDGDALGCGTSVGKCCEMDPKKCAAYTDTLKVAGACAEMVIGGSRRRSVFDNMGAIANDQLNKWNQIATTATTPAKDCCIPAFTCASTGYECGTGMKKKADATPPTKCGKCVKQWEGSEAGTPLCVNGDWDVEGCMATCCEVDTAAADTTSCNAKKATITCTAATHMKTTSMIVQADAEIGDKSPCCIQLATCADSYICPPGKKTDLADDAAKKAMKCPGAVATCPDKCCAVWDEKKCGGLAHDGMTYKADFNCTAGTYTPDESEIRRNMNSKGEFYYKWEAWMNKAATAATQTEACCIAKSTCAAFKEAAAAPKTTGSALVAFSEQLRPGAAILLAVLAVVAGGQK